MKRLAASVLVLGLVATGCTGGGGNENGNKPGVVNIVVWQGYGAVTQPSDQVPAYEADSFHSLVDTFNSTHPGIHVDVINYNNDNALTKLRAALQAGEPPDVTYQYGSSMPFLVSAPGIVDLTSRVQDPSFGWNDFYPGERAAATVDGHVLGVPALVDNLAVVYNKKLFDQAGLTYPTADWTWDEFRADATALTDPTTKQFGWSYPTDASEDTVWRWEAMLWEAGGDILTSDNTKAAFDSAAGLTALTALGDMAATDKSVYLDFQNTGKSDDYFNTGKIGMLVVAPYQLPSYPAVDYGVQFMPAFPGGNHQTIAGPDNWVLFDNGPARVAAGWTFMDWLTSPKQVLADSLACGHLPTRVSVTKMPAFAAFKKKYPGIDIFAANVANLEKARPVLKTYPQISEALGQAIVAVMLGEKDPQQALSEAAQQTNQILAVPT